MKFESEFPKGFHGSSAKYLVEYDGNKRVVVTASGPTEAANKVRRIKKANRIYHVEKA